MELKALKQMKALTISFSSFLMLNILKALPVPRNKKDTILIIKHFLKKKSDFIDYWHSKINYVLFCQYPIIGNVFLLMSCKRLCWWHDLRLSPFNLILLVTDRIKIVFFFQNFVSYHIIKDVFIWRYLYFLFYDKKKVSLVWA